MSSKHSCLCLGRGERERERGVFKHGVKEKDFYWIRYLQYFQCVYVSSSIVIHCTTMCMWFLSWLVVHPGENVRGIARAARGLA